MITIVTVNWNSYDFLYLMIESLQRFSSLPYELIVIDNSDSDKRLRVNEPNVYQFLMQTNIGHGRGLNHGVMKAVEMFPKQRFLMFLDVDCHILCYNWEQYFLNKMKNYSLIGARGVPSKPIRPACMFMRKEIMKQDWNASDGYRGNRLTPGGFDVAIKAYYKIMAEHDVGFLESHKNRYGTLNGEEWTIDDTPVVYHHWHGASLHIRQEDFPHNDLIEDKKYLFSKIPWHLP